MSVRIQKEDMMCGFIVSKHGRGNDTFIRRRGQDWPYSHITKPPFPAQNIHTNYVRDGLHFNHYLLHVTGERTPQPFVDGDVVMVYNGEIYNLPFVKSDGENIIPAYREGSWGGDLPQLIDGEFAIALYDFAADMAYFATDRFATKPIWRNGVECASYESGVGGHKIQANTIETVCISTGEMIHRRHYHKWDWRQHVTSYDACIEAFVRAVEKRYTPRCFIGLSSGYDSGAIACALRGKDFKAYSVLASESRNIIDNRIAVLDDVEVVERFDVAEQQRHLRDNAEEFRYRIRYDTHVDTSSYKADYAAAAHSYICQLAHTEGRKVCLSGTGADEIMSDYSLIPRQSEFKGRFPDDLREWSNFTGSCMYSYLGKEEAVGGSWAIETRYPFLDSDFVQAFLSLDVRLKNRHYKAPLYEYLTRERFPFAENRKIGFSPRKDEQWSVHV